MKFIKKYLSLGGGALLPRYLALLLLVLILLAYSPSLHNEFLRFDDSEQVTRNEHVLKGLTFDGVTWAFRNIHSCNWMPLTFVSHMVDVEIYGLNPAGHHAVNIILHGINVLLLFSCLLTLAMPRQAEGTPGGIPVTWRCLAVAALFGLHPIHVESVAWITERKDVLSAMFWLLTMYAYAWHSLLPSAKRMSVVTLCMALGIMAKPMVVTLPFALMLLDYWPLCRTPNAPCAGARKATWTRLVVEKIPLFFLSLVTIVVTLQAQDSAMAPLKEWGLWQRFTTVLTGYLGYLTKAFYPVNLAAHYPLRSSVPFLEWLMGIFLIAGGTYLAFRLRRKAPYFLVGWLWLLGTLVPVIGLMQVGTQAMADRYAYIPFIGLYIVLVWGVSDILEKLPRGKVLGASFIVLLCFIFAGLTWRQNHYWHDTVSLFVRMIEVSPDNCEARRWLPNGLILHDDLEDAEMQIKRVLLKHPDNDALLAGLGLIYAQRKEHEKAARVLEKSINNGFDSWVAHNTLGFSLFALKRFEEAREHFARASTLNPDSREIYKNLVVVEKKISAQVEKDDKAPVGPK